MEKGSTKLMELPENTDNVVEFKQPNKFQLITGGEPPDENWLAKLEKGTIFLARDRKGKNAGQPQPLMLEPGMVVNQALPEATNIYLKSPNGESLDIWVPTLEYSRRKELIKVLAIAKLEETPTNDDDGTSPSGEGSV